MKEHLLTKAEEMLGKCDTVALASINDEGYPRICIVSKLKSEGCNKVWIATGKSSAKIKHFLKNNKASLCYTLDGGSVTLTGNVEVLTDSQTKHDLWTGWLTNYFKTPDHPNYCILKFTGSEATIWINRDHGNFKF